MRNHRVRMRTCLAAIVAAAAGLYGRDVREARGSPAAFEQPGAGGAAPACQQSPAAANRAGRRQGVLPCARPGGVRPDPDAERRGTPALSSDRSCRWASHGSPGSCAGTRGRGRTWSGRTASSTRRDRFDGLVIQAAPPSKDAAEPEPPPVPPTPEEMYPVPSRYHVRFDEGRSIEVRPWMPTSRQDD